MKSELIWSKALEITKNAIDSGALKPLQTHKYIPVNKNFNYELRFLLTPIPKHLIEYGPKINPFIPWDKRLQIDEVNDKHILILNKYPVQLGHMLLITKSWKPQNGWLDLEDFEAISKVDNDTTGLWFFNSNKNAGASQPHRHFQLLPRHPDENICPRYEWFYSLMKNKNNLNSQIKESITIRARKKENYPCETDLFNSYMSMVQEMNLGDTDNQSKPLKPYNLLLTDEWIALITRSKDRSHGFNINSLGFAGYFLATNKSNIDILIKFGPERILMDVI